MKNRKSLVPLFVGLTPFFYSVIASYFSGVSFISIIIPNIILFYVVHLCYRNYLRSNKTVFIIFSLILLSQLALNIYNSITHNLPFTNVDWETYDIYANNTVLNSDNLFSIFSNAPDLFSGMIAIIYKLFGRNISIIHYYILPLFYLSILYTYKTVQLICNDKKKATIGATILSIYPVNYIFGMSILREIPVQLLVILSFYNIVCYMKNDINRNYFISALCVILASMMHSGVLGLLIVYSYIFIQKRFLKKIKIFRPIMIFITAAITALFSTTGIWSSASKRFSGIESGDDLVMRVNKTNSLLGGNTNYILYDPTNLIELIAMIPYRALMFAIAPLPWQVYNVETIIALLIDGIPRLIILVLLVKTIIQNKKTTEDKKAILICDLLAILITYIIFGLGVNNYGQAMRHRSKILPLELVMIASFYHRRVKNEV
ncbi:hypothetical protein IKT18_01350 [Candidatus Saccharibacteria bacterium]|nr:hypothetical protein [Candidatus Saccharibacteria bacterium]